jgi:hypothetical protein
MFQADATGQKKKSLVLALPKTNIENMFFVYIILGSELSVATATVFGDAS